jgi:hypothetical protein
MNDLNEIADNYKGFQTHKLVRLARNPEGLPLELIPVLQKELLSRGEQDEALKLSEYLIEAQRRPEVMSEEEIKVEIEKRLDVGESMESIVLKFRENGVDVFNQLDQESRMQENTFDYILSLKDKGMEEKEIQEKLQQNFSLSEEEVVIVNEKLRTKGRMNLVLGYALTGVIFIFACISISAGGRLPGIGAVIFFGLGVWRIYEGHRILGKMRND